MCKVYTGYCGTSEIEHGLCACTVDNPLAKARGLSLRTGAQTMLYLLLVLLNFRTELQFSYWKCLHNSQQKTLLSWKKPSYMPKDIKAAYMNGLVRPVLQYA